MKEKLKTFLKINKVFKIFFICLASILFLSNLFLTIILIKFTGLQSCLSLDERNARECKVIKRIITKTNLFRMIMSNDASISDIEGVVDDLEGRVDDLEWKINY